MSVHSSNAQALFRKSLESLVRDNLLIDWEYTKKTLIDNGLSLYIIDGIDNVSKQISTEKTSYEILTYIVNRIILHKEKEELLKLLIDEIIENRYQCFTGQITAWLSVLCGYYDDIVITISNSEFISNYLAVLKRKFYYDRNIIVNKFREYLENSKLDVEKRKEWLDALLDEEPNLLEKPEEQDEYIIVDSIAFLYTPFLPRFFTRFYYNQEDSLIINKSKIIHLSRKTKLSNDKNILYEIKSPIRTINNIDMSTKHLSNNKKYLLDHL